MWDPTFDMSLQPIGSRPYEKGNDLWYQSRVAQGAPSQTLNESSKRFQTHNEHFKIYQWCNLHASHAYSVHCSTFDLPARLSRHRSPPRHFVITAHLETTSSIYGWRPLVWGLLVQGSAQGSRFTRTGVRVPPFGYDLILLLSKGQT